MSDRRWGRVTVEGWVEVVSSGRPGNLTVAPTRDGVPQAFFCPGSKSELVFLPEPVQFKDGDALRLSDAVVWSRWCSGWRQSGVSSGPILDDAWARQAFSSGAVRLVPEENGG